MKRKENTRYSIKVKETALYLVPKSNTGLLRYTPSQNESQRSLRSLHKGYAERCRYHAGYRPFPFGIRAALLRQHNRYVYTRHVLHAWRHKSYRYPACNIPVRNSVQLLRGFRFRQGMMMMPIMRPLGEILGINQQVMVLAYQYGDGLTNTFWPTSSVAQLSLCGMDYGKWIKFAWKVYLCLIAAAFVLIVIADKIGYGPF